MSAAVAPPVSVLPWARGTRAPLRSIEWVSVCPIDWIVEGSGVAALVGDRQVAVFRVQGDEVYALDNCDPASGAQVLSRGIVGDRGGDPVVFSPMYKHAFSLQDGTCVNDDVATVECYPVRVLHKIVFVGRIIS